MCPCRPLRGQVRSYRSLQVSIRLVGLFADKSAPTGTASGLMASRSHRVVFILWGEVGLPYWHNTHISRRIHSRSPALVGLSSSLSRHARVKNLYFWPFQLHFQVRSIRVTNQISTLNFLTSTSLTNLKAADKSSARISLRPSTRGAISP
ncbi:hypothetical protein ALP12_200186 [Pseudomonas savastanoi pv. phaseolicola]|nr:hypothetical protein ALP12_200186 [Pseudomonas savastanoi pv. phaseolicola]